MPFERPSLAGLVDRAQTDIESRLPGADPRLRRTLLHILARVQAGGIHGLYGYLDWMARQVMPDTAETGHLERWASIWGLSRKGASSATGTIEFSGADGATVPTGTVLQRGDGVEYVTTADGTITSGLADVTATASEPGAAGLADEDVSLSLVSPIAGVLGQAAVGAGGLTGGADAEDDASLRARLLDRLRQPPHGGAERDYAAWALEVPGVTRAWVSRLEEAVGTVHVRFAMDDDAHPDGIPVQGDVDIVQAYIDERRPVTAEVIVVAPKATPLDMQIRLTPNDVAVQAAVTAELTDLLHRVAAPGGTLLISHIREAISIAAGEIDHTLIAPTGDVTPNSGHITTLGAITWVGE